MPSPPRLAEWLMRHCAPRADRDAVLGDLQEEFLTRSEREGVVSARRWYRRQVWRSLPSIIRGSLIDSHQAPSSAGDEHHSAGVFASLAQDVVHAVRSFRSAPGAPLIALAVLTLGIGATTAIFTVVDAVILRGLPFDAGDRLVAVGRFSDSTGRAVGDTAPDFLDWRAKQDVFQHFAASTSANFTLRSGGTGDPETLLALRATADLFPLLRVVPAIGTTFTAEHEIAGRDRVVVISDRLWRRRFGADPAIAGRTVTTASGVWTIIGVLPPGFTYPVGIAETTDVYLPYVVSAGERVRGNSRIQSLDLVGRLEDGATVEQARAQIGQIADVLRRQHAEWFAGSVIRVVPLRDAIVGPARPWMFLLLGAVALVLLIACVNVANLLVIRASARSREFAMRAALGASRWRLARALLVENVLLSAAATVCGVVLARWGVAVLGASLPDSMPRLATIAIDLRVLVVAVICAAATAMLFGVTPALHASRADATEALKASGRWATAGRASRRIAALFVVAEVTLAVILLVGAGLFLSSFARFVTTDLGLDPADVITVNASFRSTIAADDPAAESRGRQLASEMVDRIRRVPGVTGAAAVTGGLPLSGSVNRLSLGLPARPDFRDSQGAEIRTITPDYFDVLRIPLDRGRAFSDSDTDNSPRVIILNDVAEKAYFGTTDALGELVNVNGTICAVVGVVKAVRLGGPAAPVRLEAYLPAAQEPLWNTSFVIRTARDPQSALPDVKDAIRAVNPGQVIGATSTLDQYFERLIGNRRLNMQLLGLFGVLGVIIAAVGVYGVMAQMVGQRTREIGVRMALGAAPQQVLTDVLRRATAYVIAGLVCGIAGSLSASRLVEAFLFQVQPTDATVYAVVSLVFATAGILAAWVPARRAARVDPLATLRG